ncbi:MAG: hypothetical protein AAF329_16620 [Cyanobacteria bacterium P01_A01_bin.17]
MLTTYNIGVAGYCAQEFDWDDARIQLKRHLSQYTNNNVAIVSGLSDMGVPGIAYRIAKDLDIPTIGIAAGKARGAKNLWPCDEVYFVGQNWGDESMFFLGKIHQLVAYEGGQQTKREISLAKELGIKVIELSAGSKCE